MHREIETTSYLKRIGFTGDVRIDKNTLHRLHECHVLSVPFEDFDIHIQTPILLEFDSIYNKVVTHRRGGFCYELNFLFYTLLDNLGFSVKMISSRIHNEGGELGPMFDHMSLVVQLEETWLLDVGYGDLFSRPLRIANTSIATDCSNNYKIEQEEEGIFMLYQSDNGGLYDKKYQFDLTERSIGDFTDQCHNKQYTPDSYFVQNFICTMLTRKGRATIFNQKFTEIIDGIRTERILEDAIGLHDTLVNQFDIKIDKATIDRIWRNRFG